MIEDSLKKIADLLEQPKKVLITTHSNPDGDAIGSSLAFYLFLKRKGHDVCVMVPNDYPSFLAWMPGIEVVMNYKRRKKECDQWALDADVVFSLDYNGFARTEKMQEIFEGKSWKKVLIDHHPMPDLPSFDIAYSKTNISSTSELVYNLITKIGGKELLTKEMAECIYVGIITDTGSFSYSCNYEKTFHATAHLIGLGVDGERIHRMVYDTYSESRMRLLGYCLSERLTVLQEFSTAYIYLTKEDLARFNFQIGDTEGVVNYALSIKGIAMAALFTEKEKHIRMSFRSKGEFSVNEFVRNHFDGGGHRNASGGNSYLSMPETLELFEKSLPLYKTQLNASANQCC